jgi:hypothetical protein
VQNSSSQQIIHVFLYVFDELIDGQENRMWGMEGKIDDDDDDDEFASEGGMKTSRGGRDQSLKKCSSLSVRTGDGGMGNLQWKVETTK